FQERKILSINVSILKNRLEISTLNSKILLVLLSLAFLRHMFYFIRYTIQLLIMVILDMS
ncbi:hypothetical protein DNU70_24375, partial [Salmonella enterica subsp. enterica serovar Kentucky]|nr:hypothetical protein [Salmonella enterica subsp. enterica serovar Kentucky]